MRRGLLAPAAGDDSRIRAEKGELELAIEVRSRLPKLSLNI